MAFHCKESHQSLFSEGPVFKSSSTKDAVKIIQCYDEIFVYHKRFKEGRLHCAVQKAGISPTLYSASFVLDTLSGLDRIAFTHIIHAASEKLDVLLTSGKSLKLNDKLLKRFINNGKLALQIVISKVNRKK